MKSEEIIEQMFRKMTQRDELNRLFYQQDALDHEQTRNMLFLAEKTFKEEIRRLEDELKQEIEKEKEIESASELKDQLKRLI